MKLRTKTINRAELETIAHQLGIEARFGADVRRISRGPDAGTVELDFRLYPLKGSDNFRAVDTISGRRKGSVCWHGHYAAMEAIFTLDPCAVLISALETYRGFEEFANTAPATQHRNIGSTLYPLEHGDGCECEGTETRTPTGDAHDRGNGAGRVCRAHRVILG